MKLDVSNMPEHLALRSPDIGDIYQNQRGYYMLIVGISGNTAYYIRYDGQGEPCGSGQYGCHALEPRRRIGRVEGLPNLHVIWEPD